MYGRQQRQVKTRKGENMMANGGGHKGWEWSKCKQNDKNWEGQGQLFEM